jgi:predicted DNA-binding transcriptional regulator YafY
VRSTLTVAEVAELTGFSRDTITRMFEREKGVLILARPESGGAKNGLTLKPAWIAAKHHFQHHRKYFS